MERGHLACIRFINKIVLLYELFIILGNQINPSSFSLFGFFLLSLSPILDIVSEYQFFPLKKKKGKNYLSAIHGAISGSSRCL